jgi:hypothetical protein
MARTVPHRLAAATVPLLAAALVWPAHADVSCSSADNLCTGDPCVIRDVTVQSPCVVDFGARTVQMRGRLRLPDAGILDLKAAVFDVGGSAAINGEHTERGGHGGQITLEATGDIEIDGRIRASGNVSAGSIALEAGGLLTLNGKVRARGGNTTSGGQITLDGPSGVAVNRRIDVGGVAGGSIMISSSGGTVTIDDPVRAIGDVFSGGGIDVSGGSVTINDNVTARGIDGGEVSISSSGSITIEGKLEARGKEAPGTVFVGAAGDAIIDGDLNARGGAGGGGLIDVEAGGQIQVGVGSDLDARSEIGGTIRLHGTSVSVDGNADLTAEGNTGGDFRITATSGDLTLDGDFFARDSGVIEGRAPAGNLSATGRFRAAPAGCISLTCGGTCSTAGADLDTPLSPDCPGSPSGAFLDDVD